jgi:hypothetical protein
LSKTEKVYDYLSYEIYDLTGLVKLFTEQEFITAYLQNAYRYVNSYGFKISLKETKNILREIYKTEYYK